ncbi:MAG: hypothetical protein ACQEXO_17080 [Pseudomonadota bacterium]
MPVRSATHLPPEQQARLIVEEITAWAGSEDAAWTWYHTYPIAALGDRTAHQLVDDGRVGDVLAYLTHTELGGYA